MVSAEDPAFDDASVVADLRISHTLFLATFIVVIYDHFLTLADEAYFIWSRPKKSSAIWFLCNRYFLLLSNAAVAVATFGTGFSDAACNAFIATKGGLLFVQAVFVYSILCMRVYALFNRNKRILWFFIVVGLAVLGVSGWLVSDFPSDSTPKINLAAAQGACVHTQSHASALRNGIAWAAELLVELTIFGLTMYRGVDHWRMFGGRSSLLDCLVRDGALYFMAIVIVNTANILMDIFGAPLLVGNLSLAWLSTSLSGTLIARFMLNLHAVADSGIYTISFTDASGSGQRFKMNAMAPWQDSDDEELHAPGGRRPWLRGGGGSRETDRTLV